MTVIVSSEKKPLFTDLGQLAAAIRSAVDNALASGIEVTDVHIHPKMREIIDQLSGYTVMRIGSDERGWHDIVSDSTLPIDQFKLIKKHPNQSAAEMLRAVAAKA